MVEVIGEYHPDTSEETEIGLKAIATVDKSPENGNAGASGSLEVGDGGSSENGSHSGKSEDSGSSSSARDDEISDILNTYKENETSHMEAGKSCRVAGEYTAEEEIEEFGFNKVKPTTLATYSMHCRNCKAEVTIAVLRRKVIRLRPPREPPVEPQPAQVITSGIHRPLDLDQYRLLTGSSSSSDDQISNSLKFDGNTYKKNVEVGEVVVEEETMEFEFKKVKPKLATSTYSMHCSNCLVEVTRIVLRTTLWLPEPPVEPQQYAQLITSGARGPPDLDDYISSLRLFSSSPRVGYAPSYGDDLVGCLSCFSFFSLFTWSWSGMINGCFFNPFDIFRKKPHPGNLLPPPTPVDTESTENTENCFKKKLPVPGSVNPPQTDPVGGATTIDIVDPEKPAVGERRRWLGYEGILAEILKSIVYGSLMLVIASLSVVAFAAASDTTTLNIIALALASLIGGIVVIWHNVWDLRKDCYKENTNEQTEGAISKYKLIFGRINYFPLHAFCAILSSLILGMVPPVAYGFSFYKTRDRDFTMLVVAIASLLCVALLAIFKTFINKRGAFEYFKTMVYYITTTVSTSGVSYVAGNLVSRLVKELGLLDTSAGGVGMSLVPNAATMYLASF